MPWLKPGVAEGEVQTIARNSTPNVGFYAGLSALAIPFPRGAAVGYLVVALVAVARARGDSCTARREVKPESPAS